MSQAQSRIHVFQWFACTALITALVVFQGCGGDESNESRDESSSGTQAVSLEDRIIGKWGVGVDFDDEKYSNLLDEATDEQAEGLNQAIDRYTSISIQVEFKGDGTYEGVMRDDSDGSEMPMGGTWEITADEKDTGKMNISWGPPSSQQIEEVDVEFRTDSRFRTQMFGMPQEVEGMFFWTYSRSTT